MSVLKLWSSTRSGKHRESGGRIQVHLIHNRERKTRSEETTEITSNEQIVSKVIVE
jgi:hypothetical protein